MILQGLNSLNLNTLKTRQEANEHLARFEENEGTRQFLLKNLYRDTSTGFYAWRINLPVITNSINIVGDELSNQHVVDQDVLFMKGSESNYILSEDERPILELFPNAQFVTINGAGHWCKPISPRHLSRPSTILFEAISQKRKFFFVKQLEFRHIVKILFYTSLHELSN
jgi:hypothetical protein